MTDFASLLVADRGQKARPIHLVDKDGFDAWLKKRPAEDRALLEAHRFDGKKPRLRRSCRAAATSRSWARSRKHRRCRPGASPSSPRSLPEGPTSSPTASPAWRRSAGCSPSTASTAIARSPTSRSAGRACWSPAKRRGSRRPSGWPKRPRSSATWSTRPPPTSARPRSRQAVRDEAKRSGAHVRVTAGEELAAGYPLIAAVGRAAIAERAPRLIELEWGKAGNPRIAIVGKGVCFDSGGLDLKPASGMRQMKKDMGGAAHALALARLIIMARASGPAAPADPGGRECRVGRGLSARRHRQVAQGRVRRDRQYRRRRPADPRRRARPARRRTSPS